MKLKFETLPHIVLHIDSGCFPIYIGCFCFSNNVFLFFLLQNILILCVFLTSKNIDCQNQYNQYFLIDFEAQSICKKPY